MWAAIALSFGLAMDATAVSAARALGGHPRRELFILPAVFGSFQSAMAALGWLGSRWVGPYIAAWENWIAFGLLTLVGAKMIYEALKGSDEELVPGTVLVYIGLGIATSLDAAAAGLTLRLVPVSPWIALVLIGGITAMCSAVGYVAGSALGHRFGSKLGVLGGAVLIAIGIDILIQNA